MNNLIVLLCLLPTLCLSQTTDEKILELEEKKRVLLDSVQKIDQEIYDLEANRIYDSLSDSLLVVETRKGGKLKPKKLTSEVLKILEEGEKIIIDINSYEEGYFKACFGETCGYINELWLKKTGKYKEFHDLMIKKKELAFEKRELEKERSKTTFEDREKKREIDCLKKYSEETCKKLMRRDYWIGMTEEQAIISRGRPEEINRSVGSWGTHEQWIYPYGLYFYFRNGRLSSYQN